MVASSEYRAMGDTGELYLAGLHDAHISGVPGRAPSAKALDKTFRPTTEGFGAAIQRGVPSSHARGTPCHVHTRHPPCLPPRAQTVGVIVSNVAQPG